MSEIKNGRSGHGAEHSKCDFMMILQGFKGLNCS